MTTTIAVQLAPQRLVIPRAALRDWDAQELEAVWEEQALVIRPKLAVADSRARVRQVLRSAGMLYEPDWESPPPVSFDERARLAEKLGRNQPLSEIIIAEREDRA